MVELKVKQLVGKDKMIGLLNAKKAYPILIKTRFGIHSFGLKFPIDVVILDQNNRVVKTRQNLRPNRIFIWNPAFDKCLELPAGEIKKHGIKLDSFLGIILVK